MQNSNIELILHPIRLRLIIAIHGRQMTPRQLSIELPDVPQASLYRHISVLEKGGMLQVVEVHPVRGASERVLALAGDARTFISEQDMARAGKADHLRFFTTFAISLLKNFESFLENEPVPESITKKVGYHTYPVFLDEDRIAAFSDEFRRLTARYAADEGAAKSRRFLLSTILMPAADRHENS